MSGPATGLLLVGLCAALIAAILVAVSLGSINVRLASVWEAIAAHLTGRTRELDPLVDQVVWDIRTPRVLLAALTGAGLSVVGVCLQALVRNPLADPYVLGVSSGASLGAVLALSAGGGMAAGLGVSGAAFAGALLAMIAVFVLSQRTGRLLDSRLLLTGVAFGYLGFAATSYVQLRLDPAEAQSVMFWILGSVAGGTWSDLGIPAAAIAVCVAWLLAQARDLNALAVGDDDAVGLGVEVERLRRRLLVVSSLLTATVVSVAGAVGFVGLIVPHMARLVVGADHRRVLPVALLGGAAFLVVVDLATRTLDKPNELPLGIVTAGLGVPFFLWLLRRASS